MDKNESMCNENIVIRNYKTAEDVDYVIAGHLRMYDKEYGFNTEVWNRYLTGGVHDLINNFNEERDCLYILDHNGIPSGSAVIKHIDEKTAQFRFFLIEPELRGLGAGHRLIDKTIEFCREKGYEHIFLWTFSTLYAARHLYEVKGFRLTETHENKDWGTTILEERWDMEL